MLCLGFSWRRLTCGFLLVITEPSFSGVTVLITWDELDPDPLLSLLSEEVCGIGAIFFLNAFG